MDLARYSDEQLLQHLAGLGQWVQVRARELRYFTEHLPARVAEAGGHPVRVASLHYALDTYLDGVQEMVDRCRATRDELRRRSERTPVSAEGSST